MMTRVGRWLLPGHPHRQENRRGVEPERASSYLTSPVPQKAPAYLVPPRDLHETGTRLLRLSNDPKFILHPPAPPALNPGDDLHPVPASDLNDARKCALKVSPEAQLDKAVPAGCLQKSRLLV